MPQIKFLKIEEDVKRSLIALIAFLLPSLAYSNTAENVSEVKKFAAEKGVKISVENESEANRANKLVQVALSVGADYDEFGRGVNFSYFLNQNLLLRLGITDFDDRDLSEDQFEGNAVSFGAKKFVGNSFYVDSSLFYYSAKYTDKNAYDSNFSPIGTQITEFKRAGAMIKIGNQWQWENFTLGTDWIGYGSQIADLGSKGNRLDREDKSYFTLLNFYIGMSY